MNAPAESTVQLRLSGRQADITKVLADLVASRAFTTSVTPILYPNRDGTVRAYAELSITTDLETLK